MKILYRKNRRGQRGQALVEYVILVAVVALAALFVLANFSDRLRTIIDGVTSSLGGTAVSENKKSIEIIKELDKDGIDETE